jgi:hypothetical protein
VDKPSNAFIFGGLKMDLDALREWLIQCGIDPVELDNVQPPQGIEDVANALVISLQNTDELASVITMILTELETLKQRVEALENA